MNPLRLFIISNLLYVILACYLFFQLDLKVDSLIYALTHFFLATIANTILFKKIIKNNICLISSPVYCFLITSQVYFTSSSLKYFADNSFFFPMFELSKSDQFLGSLFGFSVIFLILSRLDRSYFVTASKFKEWTENYSKIILPISIFLLCVSLIVKVFLVTKGYGSTYSNSIFTKLELRQRSDAIFLNINEIVDQFVIIYFFLLYQINKFNSVTRLSRYIPLLITISFFSYNLIFFKSRLLILFFLLVIILMIQAFQPRKGILYLGLLLILLPLSIGMLPLLNWILGRENLMLDSFELLIQITSYRADLTDFAYAILKKSNFIGLNPDIFLQGILNSVPNIIFPGKDLFVKDAYTVGLDKIGWQAKTDTSYEIIDYQDSLFSAGSMAFGIVGFLLVPIFYLKILNYLAKIFGKKSKIGFNPILIFPLITSAFRMELEFSNIFINLRNSIQMILISLIFLFFLRLVTKKRIGVD